MRRIFFFAKEKINPILTQATSAGKATAETSKSALSILRTIIYFDVFHFPLLESEIIFYSTIQPNDKAEIDKLVLKGILNKVDEFYGIGDLKQNVKKRALGQSEAEKYWKSARRTSNILSLIPFIRCICISGSLSKGYMDKDSDVDYFIIVKKNRLWIVRAIFSFFILGFSMLNIKKYFCPNYIIVDSDLEIRDKNIFTATEIASLVPMYNQKMYEDFLAQNIWTNRFMPNSKPRKAEIKEEKKHWLDFLWNGFLFEILDDLMFSIYKWHYGRKFTDLKARSLSPTDVNFRKNNYKMHSTGHRGRIISNFEEKLTEFAKNHPMPEFPLI